MAKPPKWKQLREEERKSLSPKDFERRWGLMTEVRVKVSKRKVKDPPLKKEKDWCKKRPARILDVRFETGRFRVRDVTGHIESFELASFSDIPMRRLVPGAAGIVTYFDEELERRPTFELIGA